MNLLPSEVSLQMRFDAFCKKVITYTNYKLLREGQKRREQGYVFSDFEEGELEQYYYTYDTYPALALKIELQHISISGYLSKMKCCIRHCFYCRRKDWKL